MQAPHVILLTDAHETPSAALLDALRDANVCALIEALREPGLLPGGQNDVTATGISGQGRSADDARPKAIFYEVVPGADVLEVHAAATHAAATWPGVPLVACRQPPEFDARGRYASASPSARVLDNALLRRLGFRAIADEAAQVPALLREVEERGASGAAQPPANMLDALLPRVAPLPATLGERRLRGAFEVVAALHFASDQKSAAHIALASLDNLFEVSRWTIYIVSDSGSAGNVSLEPLAVRGTPDDGSPQAAANWESALRGDALVLSGLESEASRQAAVDMNVTRGTDGHSHFLALPLVRGEKLLGVLEAVRDASGMSEERQARTLSFAATEVALLEALSSPVASALANSVRIADAERLSQTDDLTKLHNARYLRHRLVAEVKRARRYGSRLAAVFLDLDNFKRVNDAHGHLVGSHLLMELAAVILGTVRDTDVVARYGGDEFVIVLPETGLEQATYVAERMRSRLEAFRFSGGRHLNLRLTASFGIAVFPEHAQSPQQLIASADRAMYSAKAALKNCVRDAEQFTVDPARRETGETVLSR